MGFKSKDKQKNINTISDKVQLDTEKALNNNDLNGKINLQKFILILTLGYVSFCSYSCYSLLAPFLPREADIRGLTPTQTGIIFAVYEVVRLFVSPIASSISLKMTPKVFLITGIFIKSFCTPLFGIIAYAKTANSFFINALIVRIVWAVGGSATTTGCYLVGTLLFPKHVAQIFATLELGTGCGQTIGPFLGGLLYELGNSFAFPCYIMGLMCFISIFPVIFLVKGDVKPILNNEEKIEKTTLWQTFKVEGVYINLIASAAICTIVGYNEATLDFHIREIGNYSATQSGGVFLVSAIVYGVATQFWGFVAKKNDKCYKYMIHACILCALSCAVIGPIPGIPIEPSMTLVLMSQVLLGLGMGIIFVLSFDDTVKEAIKYLPNSDSTIANVSGLFASSYALGNIIGPVSGGYMVEKFGYRYSTLPNIIMTILLAVLLIIYMIRNKKF